MVLDRLTALIDSGALSPDARQRAAAERLDRVEAELKGYSPKPPARGSAGLFGLFGRGRDAPPPAPRGVYIHGDVGRGKSMLMDLFFDDVPIESKRRVHFHEFMIEVQKRLNALRAAGGKEDPLKEVAADIAARSTLLCFDEFHVVDIADAMILGRLFEGLFELGVVVVATSNWPPRRLYENGLNRDRFLPFIDLLLTRMDVVALEGPVDYRLQRLRDIPVYHSPLGPETDAAIERIVHILADGAALEPETVAVGTRTLPVPKAAGGVAEFVFAELCDRPLGAADYLALTEHYHTIVLRDVPQLAAHRRNEARRFITLVDALYERRTMLVLSAETPPEELYAAGDGAFEFKRTVSRLMEMQSSAYLEKCRERGDVAKEDFTPFALTSDLI